MSQLNKTLTTPVNTAKPATRAVMQYVIVNFLPNGNYATARVNLLDADGKINVSHDVAFTEAELASWGANDNVVLNLALAKLGMN